MITVVNGNLLEAKENIICHQVNCKGVMGSGIAKQIRAKWPEVYEHYRLYCHARDTLGETQFVGIDADKYIANVFGQDNYGRQGRCTSYDALEKALCEVYAFAVKHNYSVAIPYNIGCGLGGGDWRIVEVIINSVFDDMPVTIYKWVE